VETQLFPGQPAEDVADDSAIWNNPSNPERSLVLGDNKASSGGVAVYDLHGKIVHYMPGGKIGNIDLRSGVKLGGRKVILVGANDRSSDTIRFWTLDPSRPSLTSVEAKPLPSVAPNYGFCMGRSSDGAHTYAFVSGENSGTFEQYELALSSGKVNASKVRTINVGSLSEACVVDDQRDTLYIAEEDVAIWRYSLSPGGGQTRRAVDRVGAGHLTADIEGVAVARGEKGKGVLVASSQGDSTYSVYDLGGSNSFRGSFRIGDSSAVDGTSDTDGISLSGGDFGSRYPDGLLVAHDADNSGAGKSGSNLKFIRFDQVFALRPGS
jgi:3-phytase